MKCKPWLLAAGTLLLVSASLVAADMQQADIPLYDGKPGSSIGDMRINPKDGAKMLWIPKGTFRMGSTQQTINAYIKELNAEGAPEWGRSDRTIWFRTEVPQRMVYLDGYWIYKYPVTVAQYRQFVQQTRRSMPEEPFWGWQDDFPMTGLAVEDADAYAQWAEVSLPTEAQWEKAARGTDGREFPWGNEWDPAKVVSNVSEQQPGPEPVGSRPANVSPYGVMDMAGNINEWCADWFDRRYYQYAGNINPKGPAQPILTQALNTGDWLHFRSMRGGGSWHCVYPDVFRTAHRSSSGLGYPSHTYGVRCVINP